MSDRELLELAAKAAGIVGTWERRPDCIQERWYFNVPYDNQGMLTGFEWNPLADDGDALRLAVKLGLILSLSPREDCRGQTVVTYHGLSKIEQPCHEGREEAARRAIVRAAAEIGKGTP